MMNNVSESLGHRTTMELSGLFVHRQDNVSSFNILDILAVIRRGNRQRSLIMVLSGQESSRACGEARRLQRSPKLLSAFLRRARVPVRLRCWSR
jgi:hypothetical protein